MPDVPEPPAAAAPEANAPAPGSLLDERRSANPRPELEERYGRGRQIGIDRRIGWGLALVAVVLGLVFVFFSGWQSTSRVEFRTVHYEVVDERTVRVDFEVTAPADARVACAIEALSPSRATVGWSVLELPVVDQRTRRFTETLVTTYGATTGTVRSCWIVES